MVVGEVVRVIGRAVVEFYVYYVVCILVCYLYHTQTVECYEGK